MEVVRGSWVWVDVVAKEKRETFDGNLILKRSAFMTESFSI